MGPCDEIDINVLKSIKYNACKNYAVLRSYLRGNQGNKTSFNLISARDPKINVLQPGETGCFRKFWYTALISHNNVDF